MIPRLSCSALLFLATALPVSADDPADTLRADAIAAIEAAGGKVRSDDTKPGNPVTKILMGKDSHFDDSLMKHAGAFPQLEVLAFFRATITDAGLAHLKNLRSLQVFWVEQATWPDGAVAAIATLPKLWGLILQDTPIPDDELQQLAGLTTLRELQLLGTTAQDADLKHLKHFPSLEIVQVGYHSSLSDGALLHLQKCPRLKELKILDDFTDAGLKHVAGISTLKELSISSCKNVTRNGVDELQRARPDLEINYR